MVADARYSAAFTLEGDAEQQGAEAMKQPRVRSKKGKQKKAYFSLAQERKEKTCKAKMKLKKIEYIDSPR